MVASISSSTVSNWSDAIYARLDTKNQGYIEKSDLQDALSKIGGDGGNGGAPVKVDDSFSALDGDSDGKVSKSELTEAMTKLGDQLNAQFDASRAGGAGGPRAPHGGSRAGGIEDGSDGADATDGTSSTSTDYVAAADTDGDGTVSDAEQAAYDKKEASEKAAGGTEKPGHQKDPMRELAHALHLLKAYAENSGSEDASTGDGSSTASVSAEA